jgi:uncharacterized protein YndB with AHSA1/START domain
MEKHGEIIDKGALRFERVLPGPIERVWAYLTESEKRRKWLAAGEMDLRVGGPVQLRFLHRELSPINEPTPDKYKQMENGKASSGEILRCEPPRVLSFAWHDESDEPSEVTFELKPQNDKVLLILTHRKLKDVTGIAAGWHTHLGILSDQFNGVTPRPFWSTHIKNEADYQSRFAKALA